MTTNDLKPVSRRNWLELVTTASLTTGLMAIAPKSFGEKLTREAENADKNSGIRMYNIRDYGAKGDGKSLDTAAVQAAIDACNKDQGGIVIVPAGDFVIGTVEMKSNVTLHLSAGGTLLGSTDGKQYHPAEAIPLHGDATLEDGNTGLIFAVKADNITIEGTGTIDGRGAQFRHPVNDNHAPSPAGLSSHQRPYHLLFYQCNNLSVRNIFLKDSAYHSVRVIQCQYVKLEGLHIHGRVIYNNDGFHFISSQYVHVDHCDVQSQDDACALFGSCKFVTVSNSSFSTRWSVFRFGGGEAENITVSNCIIFQAFGCPVKIQCGPNSRFENMLFSNIIMNQVTGPVSIGMGAKWHGNNGSKETPGVVRNLSFSHIRATVVKPIPLPGSEWPSKYNPGEIFSCITLNAFDEHFIENISFDDVHLTFPGGGTAEQGALRDVPKVAGEYYTMGVPPAYGLYARNVHGLTLNNVRFETEAPDLRPAFILDHGEDVAVNGLNVQGQKDAESALRFIDSSDVLLSAVRLLTDATVFLSVEGSENKNIKIDGGDISKAVTPLAFGNGAGRQSVKLKE